MPRFIDCMKDKSRSLWLVIVPWAAFPPDHEANLVVDGKLETLAEIDRLMRIKPGFDRSKSI